MRGTFLLLFLFSACRPALDTPTYPPFSDWSDTADPFLTTTTFTTVEERLSIDVFYEGDATETIPIDGVSTHYYIYETYEWEWWQSKVWDLELGSGDVLELPLH